MLVRTIAVYIIFLGKKKVKNKTVADSCINQQKVAAHGRYIAKKYNVWWGNQKSISLVSSGIIKNSLSFKKWVFVQMRGQGICTNKKELLPLSKYSLLTEYKSSFAKPELHSTDSLLPFLDTSFIMSSNYTTGHSGSILEQNGINHY